MRKIDVYYQTLAEVAKPHHDLSVISENYYNKNQVGAVEDPSFNLGVKLVDRILDRRAP